MQLRTLFDPDTQVLGLFAFFFSFWFRSNTPLRVLRGTLNLSPPFLYSLTQAQHTYPNLSISPVQRESHLRLTEFLTWLYLVGSHVLESRK